MNEQELRTKSLEELRVIAEGLNIKPHHAAKEEAIIRQIMQQPKSNVESVMEHKAEKLVLPELHNTEDDVRQACAALFEKPGFEAKFLEDGTVIFKCNGAEESVNLSIPLRVIRMKAETVSKGRRGMRTMGRDGTYTGYADTILV